jgi:hypothetical protein
MKMLRMALEAKDLDSKVLQTSRWHAHSASYYLVRMGSTRIDDSNTNFYCMVAGKGLAYVNFD